MTDSADSVTDLNIEHPEASAGGGAPAESRVDSPPGPRGAASVDRARRASRLAMLAALTALVAAVVVNWLFVPKTGQALPGADGQDLPVPGIEESVVLEKPALDMMPERIIQFEPITVQAIPGFGDRAAEAVFKTLTMNTEAQIPTVVYVRVEGYASSEDAQGSLEEFMAPYTNKASDVLLGQTPARQGWTSDQSSYARAWTMGVYMTFVKASFSDWTPAHTFEIIERQGVMVSEAVELFQRTGKQGVQAK